MFSSTTSSPARERRERERERERWKTQKTWLRPADTVSPFVIYLGTQTKKPCKKPYEVVVFLLPPFPAFLLYYYYLLAFFIHTSWTSAQIYFHVILAIHNSHQILRPCTSLLLDSHQFQQIPGEEKPEIEYAGTSKATHRCDY